MGDRLLVFGIVGLLLFIGAVFMAFFLKRRSQQKSIPPFDPGCKFPDPSEVQRLALEATKAVLWEFRPQSGKIYFSNPKQWQAIIGHDARNGAVTLEQMQGYMHPDDWTNVITPINDHISSGGKQDLEFEFRLRRKDGGWYWVLSKGRAVEWDKNGDPTRIVGLDINIETLMKAREKIRQKEKKFRAIFENAPYPISMRNYDNGKYIDANRAFMNAFGLDSKDLPLSIPDDLYSIGPEEIAEIHNELLEKGSITNRETIITKKDGTQVYLVFSSVLLEIQGQKHILSMAMNETPKRRAEASLKESEARFRTLFKMAPIPMAHISKDERILDLNDRLIETMGHTVDTVPTLSHAWQQAMPDPDLRHRVSSKWRSDLKRAMTQGAEMEPIECQHHYRDGSVHTVVLTTRLLSDASIIIGFYDVTERKRAEEAIDLERRQLVSIFDSINDFVYVADPHTYEILFTNRRLQDQLGKDPTGGLCYWEFQGADRPCDFCTNAIILNNNGRPHCWEHHNPHMDVYSANVDQMIKWPDGRDVRLEIAVDITERKKAEAARERLQAQLLQSQKMEAVGILAGGVAHDFNNMLGAIIGYAELMQNGMAPSDRHHETLGKILEAAKRSAGLTRQLLAFARKQTIEPLVFDVNQAIDTTLQMVRRLIGENIELSWHPSQAPCIIQMDPTHFDQILLNLCVNAKDAIADVGRVTIETDTVILDEAYTGTHDRVEPGTYALVSVSDSGCGMDTETLHRIFEPFFTTKGLGRGTGMGLATVFGIVKQNRGAINVYSEPGQGTTFRIHLPLSTGDPVTETVVAEMETPRSRGETILLVEDDPMLLEMSTAMLKRQGYNVLPSCTPTEAVRIAQDAGKEIHLFITDVVMPEMNGRDLAERVQSIRPGIKHLFMSGYTANIIAPQGVLDSESNFIQKPFSGMELAAKIRKVLDA